MDAAELRAMQAPIKDKYKGQPETALITLKAKGTLDDHRALALLRGAALVLVVVSVLLIAADPVIRGFASMAEMQRATEDALRDRMLGAWVDRGLIVAAVVGEGRKPRSRFADLLIAATAHANGLDLYTRNGDDFAGLEDLIHVVTI